MNDGRVRSRAGRTGWLAVATVALALGGCATVDPLESYNRKVFAFNDAVDRTVLKPTALFYRDNVPRPVRSAVRNFFGNFRDAWSAVNLMLQGRVGESFNDGLRFSFNSVFGIAGMIDLAGEMGIEGHGQDFGLTLGHWGLKPGPYIVWPLLGPSTLRDSLALPLDIQATPSTFVEDIATRNALTVLRLIDTRTNLLVLTDVLEDVALDRYIFVRDGYLQRRQNLVDDSADDDDDDAPANEPAAEPKSPAGAAPAAPASSPAGSPQSMGPSDDERAGLDATVIAPRLTLTTDSSAPQASPPPAAGRPVCLLTASWTGDGRTNAWPALARVSTADARRTDVTLAP